jgi:hypothetical protein
MQNRRVLGLKGLLLLLLVASATAEKSIMFYLLQFAIFCRSGNRHAASNSKAS